MCYLSRSQLLLSPVVCYCMNRAVFMSSVAIIRMKSIGRPGKSISGPFIFISSHWQVWNSRWSLERTPKTMLCLNSFIPRTNNLKVVVGIPTKFMKGTRF